MTLLMHFSWEDSLSSVSTLLSATWWTETFISWVESGDRTKRRGRPELAPDVHKILKRGSYSAPLFPMKPSCQLFREMWLESLNRRAWSLILSIPLKQLFSFLTVLKMRSKLLSRASKAFIISCLPGSHACSRLPAILRYMLFFKHGLCLASSR